MGPAEENQTSDMPMPSRASRAVLGGTQVKARPSFGSLPLDEQEKLIDVLGNAIAELDMRLQSVLTPEMTDAEGKSLGEDRPITSPLAEKLGEHNYRLSRYINRINNITARVEG